MILSIVGAKSGSQGELVGQRAAVNKEKTADWTGSAATLQLPSTEHAISRFRPLSQAENTVLYTVPRHPDRKPLQAKS